MGISYYLIKDFGVPLTYAYATPRQSVAGNSPFRGIVFRNLGTSKTDIKIRHHGKYCYPMVTPTMFPVDKKTTSTQKSLSHKCINSLVGAALQNFPARK